MESEKQPLEEKKIWIQPFNLTKNIKKSSLKMVQITQETI